MIAASKITTKMIIPTMSCLLVKREGRLGFEDAFDRRELFELFEFLEPFEPFERGAFAFRGFPASSDRSARAFLSAARFLVLFLGDSSFSFATRVTGMGRAAFDESSLAETEASARVFDRPVSFIV
jgi:hypothetical protein